VIHTTAPNAPGLPGPDRQAETQPERERLMSAIEFALVRFDDLGAASTTFGNVRSRSGQDAPWISKAGLVEHHHNGHWVLRGTFAGHYLDIDEALHVSERGSIEGFFGGAALGALLGPPGLAAGMVLGAIIGSQTGQPNELDHAPRLLGQELQDYLPSAGSAIAIIAEKDHIDEMLTAVQASGGDAIRHCLSAEQIAALEMSLSSTPCASPGPSSRGEEAVEASQSKLTIDPTPRNPSVAEPMGRRLQPGR
jgi:uncharacterized membrane protein